MLAEVATQRFRRVMQLSQLQFAEAGTQRHGARAPALAQLHGQLHQWRQRLQQRLHLDRSVCSRLSLRELIETARLQQHPRLDR